MRIQSHAFFHHSLRSRIVACFLKTVACASRFEVRSTSVSIWSPRSSALSGKQRENWCVRQKWETKQTSAYVCTNILNHCRLDLLNFTSNAPNLISIGIVHEELLHKNTTSEYEDDRQNASLCAPFVLQARGQTCRYKSFLVLLPSLYLRNYP